MRKCNACHEEKGDGEFYAASKTTCKECFKKRVRANRAANVEHYRRFDRARAMRPDRVKARAEYAATDRGREVGARAKKKWADANAEKRAAHVILGNAVRDGRVVKPVTCSRCPKGGKLHAHHHDYALPLDVEWLCPSCHTLEHKE